jgi:soluble lytic murein transglycosylase-like protein
MAIEKPLTMRDYFEPRQASAAGSRRAGAVRKSLASFPELMKSEKPAAAGGVAAGMKISEYLKRPVLTTQTERLQRPAGLANTTTAAAAASQAMQTPAEAAAAPGVRPVESGRSASVPRSRSGRRSAQDGLPQPRTENASLHAVEKSIQQAAVKYNLSPDLIRGVIRAESNFQADAVSSAGAKGLMQLMPETARELGVTNPFDVRQNIDGGSRYLRQMLDRFGGNLRLALAAYNAGPGAVEQFDGQVPYTETRQYVKRVLRFAGITA